MASNTLAEHLKGLDLGPREEIQSNNTLLVETEPNEIPVFGSISSMESETKDRPTAQSDGKTVQKPGDPVDLAKSTGMSVAVISLFLLQPSLVKQFALLFSCTSLGAEDTGLFLLENLSIQCYSQAHWRLLLGLGLPLLVLFVLGVPYGLYLWLSRTENYAMIQPSTHVKQVLLKCSLSDQTSLHRGARALNSLTHLTKEFEHNYGFLYLGNRIIYMYIT